MTIKRIIFNSRKGWKIENDTVSIVLLEGGGHIASITLKDTEINPLWIPPWKSMEPWDYDPSKHKKKYQSNLLSSICGHNLCLAWFGEPSEEEKKAGLETHGEAPIAKWKASNYHIDKKHVSITIKCKLPVAQMEVKRTLTLKKNSYVIEFRDIVYSLSRRDMPFTMCQHVTFGPPFLDPVVTVFDIPAKQSHTFPGAFSDKQRLAINKPFLWPDAPSYDLKKVVNLRNMAEGDCFSDFTTQLINPELEYGWFSAINLKMHLMLAYIWRRKDYPWVGNWEEKYARSQPPWKGKCLARGMEFANTPFPTGLKNAVDTGNFQNHKTFQWLPAMSKIEFEYFSTITSVPSDIKGVKNIQFDEVKPEIEFT